MYSKTVKEEFDSHILVLEQTVRESGQIISDLAVCIASCFQRGNKLLICGNGGSAADAQHIAAEFINRFRFDRAALPAIALSTDTSVLTSIGNDSSYDNIFSRQVEALAEDGDVFVGISTSGKSANILKAVEAAQTCGAITIGFTGEKGRETLGQMCNYCLIIPSSDTARIQECHEFAWHVICGLVERTTFLAGNKRFTTP